MNNIIDKNIYFKEKKPYYIYIHTCPNRYTYVGMSQNPKQRWNSGEGYKLNKDFYQCIQRFRWENIKHEIVAETYYKWIAQKIERTLITHFKKKKLSFNESNIETKLLKENEMQRRTKRIGQYDKNTGELIKEYDSIGEARNYTGIPEQGIRATCLDKTKTSGGYIWKYL